MTPFNLALHEHLLSLGYTHIRVDADWEDSGNAETGPIFHGHNGYDEYTGPDEVVFVSAEGELDWDERNLEYEKWIIEEPWDTDGDTSKWNENGESSEMENDRYASRNWRD
jgi:hypothetical protein